MEEQLRMGPIISKETGKPIEIIEVFYQFDEKVIRFKDGEIMKQYPYGLFNHIYRGIDL